MTQIVHRQGGISTFDKQLGWLNVEQLASARGPHLGGTHDFITKGGLPLMVPDLWPEDNPEIADRFVPLPKGTMAITTDGHLKAVE